jgi:hypothetical protein
VKDLLCADQFIEQAPPQHSPPISQARGAALELEWPLTATLGTDISFVCSLDWHEGQMTSCFISRTL